MLIDTTLLIGILIILVVIIVAAVLIIKLRMNKDQPKSGGLASLLSRGKAQEEEQTESEAATVDDLEGLVLGGTDNSINDDFQLPGLEDFDAPGIPEEKPSRKGDKTKKEPGKSVVIRIKELLGSLLKKKKSKEDMRQDVKEIDDQLNQVLAESQGISMDITPNTRMPDISMMGLTLDRENNKSMESLEKDLINGGESKRPQFSTTQQSGMLDMGTSTPESMVSQEMTSGSGSSKPSEQAKPSGPAKPSEQASPAKASDKVFEVGTGSDLMSELESEAVKEVVVDMSIMKDLKDVPVTVEELESDLKGILDQVTYNARFRNKK